MTRGAPQAAGRWQAEDGEGLLSTVFGVLMFLLMLLFAVQATTHLYATTVVTTAAYDAARLVSGQQALGGAVTGPGAACSPPSPEELQRADLHLEQLLGGLWAEGAADWTGTTADRVTVTVAVRTPARVVGGVGSIAGLDQIRRTVALDRECFR